LSLEATAIQDEAFARLSGLSGYNRIRKGWHRQLQGSDLPALSVFILAERMTPDGDGNAGEPRFVSIVTLAISLVRGFSGPEEMLASIDSDADDIEKRLLCDPDFVKLGADALFESVERIQRTRLMPQDGETYFAELRLEMDFKVRVDYPPVLPDDYRGMTITARLAGADANTPAIIIHRDQPAD
jgi:hypothetical protein